MLCFSCLLQRPSMRRSKAHKCLACWLAWAVSHMHGVCCAVPWTAKSQATVSEQGEKQNPFRSSTTSSTGSSSATTTSSTTSSGSHEDVRIVSDKSNAGRKFIRPAWARCRAVATNVCCNCKSALQVGILSRAGGAGPPSRPPAACLLFVDHPKREGPLPLFDPLSWSPQSTEGRLIP